MKDPRWGALTADGRQTAADLANAALFGLRNLQKADCERVRTKYLALADACIASHRAFARDAPTIQP